MRPRVRELLPSSESHRFEKNGLRQIDDSLAGQKINEAEGFRWDYRDVIAFSCVFRQRDHEKLVIPSPLRCFGPSRSAVMSLLTRQTEIILVSPRFSASMCPQGPSEKFCFALRHCDAFSPSEMPCNASHTAGSTWSLINTTRPLT